MPPATERVVVLPEPVANPAKDPKMNENTNVVNTGWIIAHNGPRIVCLYKAVKSLLTNNLIKELN